MGNLVDFSSLNEMLYSEEALIKEFAAAAILSFSEFNEHYREYLSKRDEVPFRKSGHKIKPVAQMLGLQQIVDEYERGKTLLWEEKTDEELLNSINKIDAICSQVLSELQDIINK